jgi:hypothetical protein
MSPGARRHRNRQVVHAISILLRGAHAAKRTLAGWGEAQVMGIGDTIRLIRWHGPCFMCRDVG